MTGSDWHRCNHGIITLVHLLFDVIVVPEINQEGFKICMKSFRAELSLSSNIITNTYYMIKYKTGLDD